MLLTRQLWKRIAFIGLCWSALPAFARGESPRDVEMEALAARVAELEAQNAEILARLEALHTDRIADHSEAESGRPDPAVPSTAAASDEEVVPRHVKVGRDSQIGFYGFIRLDAIFDDSRASAIQTPTFIRSEAPGEEDEDSFNIHPRLTRFGFDYQGPRIGGDTGPKLGGKIEIDFQAGGGEARQQMRMRHGYMTLDWDRTRLLVGQTWDLISPLYPAVNADTLMWNAGNLGDRRPQIRGRHTKNDGSGGTFTIEGGLGLSGAIDGQDLDANGIRDGDDGLLQNLQARVAWGRESGDTSWTLGVHGLFGHEETEIPVAGEDSFESQVIGIDFAGQWGRVGLKGEAWTGSNLDDFRGGAGQGVNAATGNEIDASGGWLEIGLGLTKVYSLFVGYTMDDPSDGDLASGGRTKNEAWYLVNRFQIARPFLIGIDYLSWQTTFKDLPKGDDNRLNLYLIYTF